MDLIQSMVRGILTLDGAMGTQLMSRGKSGCFELLNVEQPELVASIHREYIEAGADIITTNTTCADALCLSEYGLQERSYELALAGPKVAREVADSLSTAERRRYVAGSVGPTTRNLTLANDTTPEAIASAYADVIRGLIDGGVDLILIETAMDAANVRIAVEQVRKLSSEMPIIVSAVLSRLEGRVASGATIAKFVEELPMEEILAVGFNCSMGEKQQAAALKALAAVSNKPVVLYPALSQPQEAPNRFIKPLDTLMRAGGVNIIGGCCGTTPAHIEALAKAAARWRPRKIE